jgi:hypothetical protein
MHPPSYKPAPVPLEDNKRVQFLRSLAILDTKPDISFDRIAEAASTIMHSPIALISFLDSDRQWIKSKVGMDASEIIRDDSFCSHVIGNHGDGVFLVCDTLQDERFKYHNMVIGKPNIRFYAAVPLVVDGGQGFNHKIGTLCIFDFKPRNLDDYHHVMMETLAQLVVTEINMLRGWQSVHYTQFMQEINAHSSQSYVKNQLIERIQHCNGGPPSLAEVESTWKATLTSLNILPYLPIPSNLTTRDSPAASSISSSAPCSPFDSDADEDLWPSSSDNFDSGKGDISWWSCDGTPPPSSGMNCS